MKNIIKKEYKHLLYRDKCKDTFLLTKYLEIYQKSNTNLGVSCWSRRIYLQLKKEGIISEEWGTADGLITFEIDIKKLALLIATGSHSRRVNRNGRWLKDKEKRLGHRIIPFSPKF